MTFLEWILTKLRNHDENETEFDKENRIYIEPMPPVVTENKEEDKKEDKRVVIIDL